MENNKYRNVKIFASDFIYLFIDFCSNLKFRERLNEQNKQKRMKVYEKTFKTIAFLTKQMFFKTVKKIND